MFESTIKQQKPYSKDDSTEDEWRATSQNTEKEATQNITQYEVTEFQEGLIHSKA